METAAETRELTGLPDLPRHGRGREHIPCFSKVPLAVACFRTGLLEGAVLSLPRLGREAMLGQKSSVLLSVCVLLSLLPVLAWVLLADVVEAGGDSAEAGVVVSRGADPCPWGSFPSRNPEARRSGVSMIICFL